MIEHGATAYTAVVPGLVPGIHVVPGMPLDVDGRDKPGHDDVGTAFDYVSKNPPSTVITLPVM